jgi:DNA-binding MarR family transcriptional regulator
VNDAPESEARITLGLLDAVQRDSAVSQRRLAHDLGIALGLTNAYLKRCVRKGLIKMASTPANRYAYYLTPKGFSEKSRLTAQYLARSFRFYRDARDQCGMLLADAAEAGRRRVVLAGEGELAEIATLCALKHPVEIVGILPSHGDSNGKTERPLGKRLEAFAPLNAVLLTELATPQGTYDRLVREVDPSLILVPPLLRVQAAERRA